MAVAVYQCPSSPDATTSSYCAGNGDPPASDASANAAGDAVTLYLPQLYHSKPVSVLVGQDIQFVSVWILTGESKVHLNADGVVYWCCCDESNASYPNGSLCCTKYFAAFQRGATGERQARVLTIGTMEGVPEGVDS
ncbi:hypothetical protein BV898_16429 [Hypsibius exemplaris]|uniref:Uncharacterized protein n=1 Tax=Hypsibius exemplaris TaxID=2072580 RepID=A0A9X6NK81_HYPEX|nr:hypothetical protein BV898_16429 [Hypsibius exemplaris]